MERSRLLISYQRLPTWWAGPADHDVSARPPPRGQSTAPRSCLRRGCGSQACSAWLICFTSRFHYAAKTKSGQRSTLYWPCYARSCSEFRLYACSLLTPRSRPHVGRPSHRGKRLLVQRPTYERVHICINNFKFIIITIVWDAHLFIVQGVSKRIWIGVSGWE